MAKLTPTEFQEKHAKRLKAALPEIRVGIARVTESPTAKSADKIDKMRDHLMAKFEDGTIEARLRAVTLADWKKQMTDVGLGRISSGIDGAAGKVKDFAAQLLPAVDAAKATIAGMPDLTLEDSIGRMDAFIREMAKFHKK
jgi:hypothetical protein